MQFQFEVGVQERHRVGFVYDKVGGAMRIDVDGVQLLSGLQMFSLRLRKRYDFVVGSQERHQVGIEKVRRLFLPRFRPDDYRIYIDGQLIRSFSG